MPRPIAAAVKREISRAVEQQERQFRKEARSLKARVRVKGLGILNRNSRAARALVAWQQDLIGDCGGMENISTQRMALIELATRTRLLVDHCDAFLLEQPSFINRHKRALFPIVRERQMLVDSLARLLSQIGLDKFEPKAVNVLEQHLASQGLTLAKPRVEVERKEVDESEDEGRDDSRSAE